MPSRARDRQPMACAGLWEAFKWPDETIVRTYAIVTCPANDDVAELHDRMPVILEHNDGTHGSMPMLRRPICCVPRHQEL
jgi:putative SOS response-associated peptidase YedK